MRPTMAADSVPASRGLVALAWSDGVRAARRRARPESRARPAARSRCGPARSRARRRQPRSSSGRSRSPALPRRSAARAGVRRERPSSHVFGASLFTSASNDRRLVEIERPRLATRSASSPIASSSVDPALLVGLQERKQHVLCLDPGLAQALRFAQARAPARSYPRALNGSAPSLGADASRMPGEQLAPDRDVRRDSKRLKRAGGHTVPVGDQPEQQMLGADELVAQRSGRVARLNDGLASAIGEQLEHDRQGSHSHDRARGHQQSLAV